MKALLTVRFGDQTIVVSNAFHAPRMRRRNKWATALTGLFGYRLMAFFRGRV
jgi:hypothetical protein